MLQPSPLSPSFTHYLHCSDGKTALKYAIEGNKSELSNSSNSWTELTKADVVAYLRSIGAPQ